MKLIEIKAQFKPGDKWHAVREEEAAKIVGNLGTTILPGRHRDEVREVLKLGSREIVFRLEDGKSYYTPWPKASEVIEAREGFLKFALNEGRTVVTLTKLASPAVLGLEHDHEVRLNHSEVGQAIEAARR